MTIEIDENSYRNLLAEENYELADLRWFVDEYEKYLKSENEASSAIDRKSSIYLGFIVSISFAIITLINIASITGGVLLILCTYLFVLIIAALHFFQTTRAREQFSVGLIPKNREGNHVQINALLGQQKEFHLSKLDVLDSHCRKMNSITFEKSKGLIWGQNIFFYGSVVILLVLFFYGLAQRPVA